MLRKQEEARNQYPMGAPDRVERRKMVEAHFASLLHDCLANSHRRPLPNPQLTKTTNTNIHQKTNLLAVLSTPKPGGAVTTPYGPDCAFNGARFTV